ncbi:hypothetical protein GCM10009741_58520 [Kribbella lupini]|uniref:HNH nuclease domain-containing protein n=2 Tax=Kribbella lupini TaxID=291602 RepID=A0ABN2BTB1_9ACTN
MSGSEMLSALDATQAEIARLQARRLRLLAALDAHGHAAELGARDTAQLIALRHRLDSVDVRRDLRLAATLPKYPEVDAALTSGAEILHPAQAEAIVTALERIPTTAMVPADNLRVAEEEMVKAAQILGPRDLRKLGKSVRDRLDTDGIEPPEARALAAETLWLKRGDHGAEFGGYLAGEHAELLHTLIFAGSRPHLTTDGHRDPRTRGKRQADALTTILTTAAATGTAAPAHGDIKPHLTVTIDLDNLRTATGTGTLSSGATLSASAVRRIACDAGIIPMILGTNSEPLDLGTEHRFVTPAIRHALNVRDQGCIICTAPPAICEAHHLTHWADGGPTNLTNLALLCKTHHIEAHQGHWPLTFKNGRPHHTRPPWTTPDPTPTQTPPAPTSPNHPDRPAPTSSNHPDQSAPRFPTNWGRSTPPPPSESGRSTPPPPSESGRSTRHPSNDHAHPASTPSDAGRITPHRSDDHAHSIPRTPTAPGRSTAYPPTGSTPARPPPATAHLT